MGRTTTFFYGLKGPDPVDQERARVAVEAQRERALDRGVLELHPADLEPLDNWARKWNHRGLELHLDRVESVVDPLDPRPLPQYLAKNNDGGLWWFNKAPAHRQPKR